MTSGGGLRRPNLLHGSASLRLLLVGETTADGHPGLSLVQDQFPFSQVTRVLTLAEALTALTDHRFDLVLASLTLSDASGEAVVRALRLARPETALIVLTRSDDGDLALRALSEGAQDYLVQGQYDGPRLATVIAHGLQRKRVEAEAQRYLQLAKGLLDALQAPTCAVDGRGTITIVNRTWRDIALANGGRHARCGPGVSYLDVCDHAAQSGDDAGAIAATVADGIREVLSGSSDSFRQDYPCPTPDGERWFSVHVTPAVINNGRGAVISHVDITDMHDLRSQVSHQAHDDTLAELPDRLLAIARLQQARTDAEHRGLHVEITHLDLRDLRQVNEHVGYAGGDAVLAQAAERLTSALRPGDTLTRIAGKEFLVVWHDLGPTEVGGALALTQGLIDVLRIPFEIDEVPLTVRASAGVVTCTPGRSVDDILEAADAALQESKRRGHGRIVAFTEELRAEARLRRALEGELRSAVEDDLEQFVLHYQPIVDLGSGSVVAVEALVRWQHPTRGLLGAARFVPLAERSSLIGRLGDWVLERAVHDAAALTHQGRELDVAVNFSVLQLDAEAVTKAEHALASSGLRPGRLILEVTESAIAEDEAIAAAALQALSRLGIKIAIDDFGTGYSSLLYLRRYPIDTLKIDREFVAGLGLRAEDGAICRTITALAVSVGASTVGEGVETSEQYAALRSMGCRQGQGFLWSPGVALADLPRALVASEAVPRPTWQPRTPPATPRLSAEVQEIIVQLRAEGASMNTIAGALNSKTGLHPRGVRWTASTVAQAIERDADD